MPMLDELVCILTKLNYNLSLAANHMVMATVTNPATGPNTIRQ